MKGIASNGLAARALAAAPVFAVGWGILSELATRVASGTDLGVLPLLASAAAGASLPFLAAGLVHVAIRRAPVRCAARPVDTGVRSADGSPVHTAYAMGDLWQVVDVAGGDLHTYDALEFAAFERRTAVAGGWLLKVTFDDQRMEVVTTQGGRLNGLTSTTPAYLILPVDARRRGFRGYWRDGVQVSAEGFDVAEAPIAAPAPPPGPF